MMRICQSLSLHGYNVLLVGRTMSGSVDLLPASFKQHRLHCWFERGKLFYIEYNIRLFIFLLFTKADAICAIDLDTIVPCYFASYLKKTKRLYDAHELFCEMKEIVQRPAIYKAWKKIEQNFVPKFPHGYTVNEVIAAEFKKMYGAAYTVVRNIAVLEPFDG